jgi:hypothetical protein
MAVCSCPPVLSPDLEGTWVAIPGWPFLFVVKVFPSGSAIVEKLDGTRWLIDAYLLRSGEPQEVIDAT